MGYKAVSLAFAFHLILTHKINTMKTIQFKKAMYALMVAVLIIATVVITKNIIHNIKYLYGLESSGSGTRCFFDLIQ